MVPDPLNPQTLNRYAYALNNPLLFIDPTGHDNYDMDIPDLPDLDYTDYNYSGYSNYSDYTNLTYTSYDFNYDYSSSFNYGGYTSINYSFNDPFQYGIEGNVGSGLIDQVLQLASNIASNTAKGMWNEALQEATAAYNFLKNLNNDPGALLFLAIGAPEMGEFAATGEEATALYRAVMPAELADIEAKLAEGEATQIFSNPAGIESKYFATTAEDAASYAQQAYARWGDGPFTIVESAFPSTSITPDMISSYVDRGIYAITVRTEQLDLLARPQVWPYVPYISVK